MQIFSFSPFGYDGALVAVEVDLRRGIPAVDVVGLADGAVKESRERMRSAIRNSGFEFPQERVLISLSPADLKKEGAGFDLALALAVLCANSKEKRTMLAGDVLVMGELELSGALRPVKGVQAAVSTAAAAGISYCIVSAGNGAEAKEVPGVKIFAAQNLTDAFEAIFAPEAFSDGAGADDAFLPDDAVSVEGVLFPAIQKGADFADVCGQQELVRALQVAAAGGHNVLAYGPPGCGKTLAMQRFPALLPLLTVEEAQSVTRIHSLAGLLQPSQPLMRIAPFRQPHQTASIEGLCGGGVQCRPGEISLAHNGVLFLDEAAEFKGPCLQMLRVPLESGSVTISRAGRTTIYPAQFQLLMAANPCPCGNYGVPGKLCLCSARAVEQYWRKFSAPLLDRIALRVAVGGENSKSEMPCSLSTAALRGPIAKAVLIQRTRQGKRNARLTPQEMLRWCALGKEEQEFLHIISVKSDLSQRSISCCLQVARTISDMEQSEKIKIEHLQEAIALHAAQLPLMSAV